MHTCTYMYIHMHTQAHMHAHMHTHTHTYGFILLEYHIHTNLKDLTFTDKVLIAKIITGNHAVFFQYKKPKGVAFVKINC